MLDNYLDLVSALESMSEPGNGNVYVPGKGEIADARTMSGDVLSAHAVVYEMFSMYHRLLAGQVVNLFDHFVLGLGDGNVSGSAEALAAGLEDVATIARDYAKFCSEHPELEPGGC